VDFPSGILSIGIKVDDFLAACLSKCDIVSDGSVICVLVLKIFLIGLPLWSTVQVRATIKVFVVKNAFLKGNIPIWKG